MFSVQTNDLILGGGVFLMSWFSAFSGMIARMGLPFPGFLECFIAGSAMLFIVEFISGGVSGTDFKEYLWVGLGAAIGCLIGSLFGMTLLGSVGGGIGAVVAYKRKVLMV